MMALLFCIFGFHWWEEHPTRRANGEPEFWVCRWCHKAEDNERRKRCK